MTFRFNSIQKQPHYIHNDGTLWLCPPMRLTIYNQQHTYYKYRQPHIITFAPNTYLFFRQATLVNFEPKLKLFVHIGELDRLLYTNPNIKQIRSATIACKLPMKQLSITFLDLDGYIPKIHNWKLVLDLD